MNGALMSMILAAFERQGSLWQVGPFELAMLIAGGIITIGMIVAFIFIFLRKDDQEERGDQSR